VKMFGLGPIFDSMGLINTIYSYVDDIAISFTCDRDMMPHPDAYAAALRASFEELRAASVKPAAAKAEPKKPKKIKEKA
jgi:diacylglycerol O-acyltransferase / wax synthase